MRRSASACAGAGPSMRSTMSRQQAADASAPAPSRPSSSALGAPTAANSAGHMAASVLRATLTTMSRNCGAAGAMSRMLNFFLIGKEKKGQCWII